MRILLWGVAAFLAVMVGVVGILALSRDPRPLHPDMITGYDFARLGPANVAVQITDCEGNAQMLLVDPAGDLHSVLDGADPDLVDQANKSRYRVRVKPVCAEKAPIT